MNQKQADLAIINTQVFTQDGERRVLTGADVVICGSKILGVGPGAAAAFESFGGAILRKIDGTGKAVFPGMQNLHVHVFQSLLKGLGADRPLIPWVKAALSAGPRMTPELYSLAAKIAAIEQLRGGVTTIADFNYMQHREDLAETSIRTFEEIGLRLIYMDVHHDTGAEIGVEPSYILSADEALTRTRRLYREYADPAKHPLTSVWMGASVPWGTTPDLYRAIMEFSRETGTPYTLHLLETPDDDESAIRMYGRPIVPVLEEMGFLSEKLLAVHCVCASPENIEAFARTGTNVIYCPAANAYLGSGIAPIARMKEAGVNVAMGTDGAASNNSGDMIESLKLGIFLQRAGQRDPTALTAQDMLDFVTVNAARAAGRPDLGSIEEGKTADVFVYDPHFARSCPNHDTLASLMYNSSAENIAATVVNGRVVYENGRFSCGLDEQQVVEETERAVKKFMEEA